MPATLLRQSPTLSETETYEVYAPVPLSLHFLLKQSSQTCFGPIGVEGDQRQWLKQDPCVYCGRLKPKSEMSTEHILPHSLGGRNHWSNYARACKSCNTERGSTPLLLWLLLTWRRKADRNFTVTPLEPVS